MTDVQCDTYAQKLIPFCHVILLCQSVVPKDVIMKGHEGGID